ncbi:MAG: penicillin-binding protein activator [Nitrospinae bacterium]|nr:penicillin-binding protein activator [Nitrospinota bacterium]
MHNAILKFMLTASLTALLATGCTPGPGSQTTPGPAARPPAPEAKAETPPAPEPATRKALAEGSASWSAPAPAPPRTPLAALGADFEKNPTARDADKTLLDIAKHQLARGELESAARSLERLQEKFPLSHLYPESAFHRGLALQASGRDDEAWISLRSSLSKETSPERRALLEASLGDVYEKRGEPFSALLSYARALRSDRKIFGKKILIERIEALAREIAPYRLRTAAERFAGTPAGMYLQAALAAQERQEKPSQSARDDTPPKSPAVESGAPSPVIGRVGIMLPLSGALGAAGGRVYDGIRLALRHSLAKYPGLRIQLAVRDTKSAAGSAGDAAKVAAELIEKEKALALIGPLITEAAEDAAQVANRQKTPMLTPFAVRMRMNPDFTWVFRNSLTNRLQAQGVASYAIRYLGVRRFAVLYPAARDGIELTDAFTQAVENLGGEVVKIVSYPENATDFGAQMRALGGMDDRRLNRLKRSLGINRNNPYQIPLNFEALFVPVRHEEAVLIAPQVLFYNMREVRLLGGSGWNDPRLLEHGERYVEGAVFVDGFFPESEEPMVARFVREFREIYGKTPDIFSALGYDAAQIIFAAIAQGAKTREDVRQYLASLRGFEGIMGLTDMGPDNDAQRQLFVLSVEKKKIRHLQMVTPHRTFAGGAPIGENARFSPAPTPTQ